MTVAPMPDIEAVCTQALRAEGLRAYSSLPKTPQWPVVTVQRTGGLPTVKQKLDAGVIDFNTWALNKADARDLADEVRQIIHGLEGTTNVEWDCHITAVEDSMPLIFQPDSVTARDRYVFALRVYAHSVPATS